MTDPIEIRINGQSFVDFKRAIINCSMDELARSFYFEFADRWLQTNFGPLPFVEGDPCQVLIYGRKVIDGFIDEKAPRYNDTSHSVGVSGRSWTGHLVDCSAIFAKGSWKLTPLLQIATNICQPFGITVLADNAEVATDIAAPFKKWAIEDEEKAYDCIARAAKMRGVFLMSDGNKNLLLSKASKIVMPGALTLGGNIKDASSSSRFTERFSQIIVKSQSAGDDVWNGANTSQISIQTDVQVKSYRPLVIVNEGGGGKAELDKRATWERNVRAGRSRRLHYQVQGFVNEFEQLWEPNRLIMVDDAYQDVKGLQLIYHVSFELTERSGEIVTIDVGAPEAYDVLAPPPAVVKRPKVLW